jgi:hypothetical protein
MILMTRDGKLSACAAQGPTAVAKKMAVNAMRYIRSSLHRSSAELGMRDVAGIYVTSSRSPSKQGDAFVHAGRKTHAVAQGNLAMPCATF